MSSTRRFRIECGGKSSAGGRQVNDDAFYYSEALGLCVVADGIGSHHGEGLASQFAVSTFVESFEQVAAGADRYRLAEAFKRIFGEVNSTLHQRFLARDPSQRLGTTLVALAARADGVVHGHIGDSRIYRVRAGAIEAVTRDHAFERERLPHERRAGSANAPKRYLTRAVGTTPDAAAEVQIRESRVGDLYLLCTDGLTEKISEPELLAECRMDRSAGDLAATLVGLALRRQTRDNVTLLTLRILE